MTSTTTLTLLFTDLVGSTALSSSLAPVEAEALRRTHLALLRDAVVSAGGVEVKNLGDGLMVAFQSPSGALECAVAMQGAIERHNRRGGPPLAVRIGISGGEITEEEGDYFGDPVVEAARLCAAAEGDQVLVAAIVRAMAGRNAPAEIVDVGELELKGLPEPVATGELRWRDAVTHDGGVPLPSRLAAPAEAGIFPFTGRRSELATLADACKHAGDGRLRVALVGGEAGVGKTALVAEAARSAHGTGAAVTFGACLDGLAVPYQPWVAALTHLVTHASPDVLGGVQAVHAAALAALLPSVADRFPSVESVGLSQDSERFVLLDAVAALLERLSTDAEVVVVLDDLQWADAASIDTLRHLLASPAALRVAVLGTYRGSDLSRDDPLAAVLAELRRDPTVVRVDLDGLDDAEMIELVERTAGFELPPEGIELAQAVRQETSGNPFFAVEVLRHLGESGSFQSEDDGTYSLVGSVDALVLPTSVREVVGHRVGRLGVAAERLLSLASVIGVDFDLDVLATVAEMDEDQVIDVLEAAAAAGIVAESGAVAGHYRFLHALIAHTLAHELGPTRRQRVHQRVAEALEALGAEAAGRVAELAHHWLAATRPADTDRAVHYATLAGEAALEALAPSDAVTWYQRAVELMDRRADSDPLERGRVLAGLGRAQLEAGLVDHRATLRTAGRIARELGDRDLLVAVALCRLSGFEEVSLVDPDRQSVIEAALEVLDEGDLAVRAQLLVALADESDRRDSARRESLVDEAVTIAMGIDDEAHRAEIIEPALRIVWSPDNIADRMRLADDLIRWSGPSHGVARFQALGARHSAALELGDRELAQASFREMRTIADALPLPYLHWQLSCTTSLWCLLDGDLDGAEAATNDAFELGTRIGSSAAGAILGVQLLAIRIQQGRVEELLGMAAAAVEEYETLPGWDSTLAAVYGEAGGHRDEQRALLDAAVAEGFANALFDITYTVVLSQWGEVAADLEHEAAAAVLVDRLLPYEERMTFAGVHTHGAVALFLGRLEHLLGRHGDAEQHLRRSLAIHERMKAPYWVARSQIDLAALLDGRGRTTEAAALADDAKATADRFGFGGLHRRFP